jgi:hypothetical protein
MVFDEVTTVKSYTLNVVRNSTLLVFKGFSCKNIKSTYFYYFAVKVCKFKRKNTFLLMF